MPASLVASSINLYVPRGSPAGSFTCTFGRHTLVLVMLAANYLPNARGTSAGVGEIDAGVASTFDAPPNPNVGLYQFVTSNAVTGLRTFDSASWASYLASGASWAQASWAEASWNANLDSMMATMASFSE